MRERNPQSSRLKEKAAEQGTPRPLAAKWHFPDEIGKCLGARFPARHILDLFRAERIDRHPQCAQLQARDLLINCLHEAHAGIELLCYF
jgi:hypothetical protein